MLQGLPEQVAVPRQVLEICQGGNYGDYTASLGNSLQCLTTFTEYIQKNLVLYTHITEHSDLISKLGLL